MSSAFEPTWKSVRPAVTINIDFGTGKKVTRTLNGNIATYVCTPEGVVLDIIPGIYDVKNYVSRLQQAVALHRWTSRRGPKRQTELVKLYHQKQAKSLREKKGPLHLVQLPGRSIRGVEWGLKYVVTQSSGTQSSRPNKNTSGKRRRTLPEESRVPTTNGKTVKLPLLSGSKALAADVKINESVRRLKIHEYLAKNGPTTPPAMTKWLYREVLNTDLDDPYFGLKKLLVDSDPFVGNNEEKATGGNEEKTVK
jgi:hypothetical protein